MLTVGNVRKVTEYDEAGYDMTYDAVPVEVIEALPALDVEPVVHDIGIRTSFLRVKDVNEWQSRIILEEGEKSKNCAVFYQKSDSDLAPVVHARWQDRHCTKCKNEAALLYECIGDDEGFAWYHSDFCPNCGAKMDEEVSCDPD